MATLQRNLSGEVVSVPVTRLIEQNICFPRLSCLLHSPLKKVTVGEKPISRHRPDWHRGKRANPVSGVRQPHTTGFTRMWAILKVRITEETRPGSNTGYLFREGTHLPKKSILATQITALIHSHLSPVWMGTQLLIPLMETHNGINLAVFHLMFLTVRHFLLYQME